MVPKQTLSVHLISRFLGCAWQSCYILFNNREQQPWLSRVLGREQLPPCVYSGEFGEVVELFMTWEVNKVFFFFFTKMERKPSVYIVRAGSILV